MISAKEPSAHELLQVRYGALLYHALNKDQTLFDTAVRSLEQLTKRGDRERRVNERMVDDRIEDTFFGNTTHDLLKSLSISDSQLLPADSLCVQSIGVLSATRDGSMYKKFDVFAEMVKVGCAFEMDVKIDEFYFQDAAERELRFRGKKQYLENLSEVFTDYSHDLIDYEYNFFKQYHDTYADVCEFYEHLLDIETGFLLRMSWGSGWQSMTAGRLFTEEPFFRYLRERYKLGKRREYPFFVDPFPKSRRLVFDEKLHPVGWVHLEAV